MGRSLRGTTQNDLLKEFVARGTSIFHPEISFRFSTELIKFAVDAAPNWNPINVLRLSLYGERRRSGRGNRLRIRQRADDPRCAAADASAADFEQTVKRISFFINSGIELVPEICKIRAYFKLWPALCKSEYGIDGVLFRAGCQVRSLTLTEQQPEVNILRIAYEALPVVLSADARVNALQLPGFREAMSLPDQAEQLIGLRTQQVLMHETGVTNYGDIFEGSKIIEKLTDETMRARAAIAMRMREAGYARSIGIVSAELTRATVGAPAQTRSGRNRADRASTRSSGKSA